MNSSVETRYPFLDEEVFAFLAGLHPRWKMRGLRDKFILRLWPIVGCRSRSPGGARRCFGPRWTASTRQDDCPTFVDQLLSPESLRPDRLFRCPGRHALAERFQEHACRHQSTTMVEMGLVGVSATQLWHHTYIDGGLAELPDEGRRAAADDGVQGGP